MSTWAIVLAGGEGTRMASFLRARLGEKRPKQYCVLYRDASMLEHTWQRASQVASSERIVTVIGRGHRNYLPERTVGKILEQPEARGTAAGTFLAASYIRLQDPHARLAILPSDHFVWPEDSLVRQIEQAVEALNLLNQGIVLVGAKASRPAADYGWIQIGEEILVPQCRLTFHQVLGFVEKPDQKQAETLYRHGALWNTMIAVTPLPRFWSLAQSVFPDMISVLERLGGAYHSGSHPHPSIIDDYWQLKERDYSKDFLELLAHECTALMLRDVYWSDWGEPERVLETLSEMEIESALKPAIVT